VLSNYRKEPLTLDTVFSYQKTALLLRSTKCSASAAKLQAADPAPEGEGIYPQGVKHIDEFDYIEAPLAALDFRHE